MRYFRICGGQGSLYLFWGHKSFLDGGKMERKKFEAERNENQG